MRPDMPPFGADDDPHIKQALNWLLSFADPRDWHDRLSPIEQRLFGAPTQPSDFRQTGYDQQDWPDDDRMGWYLYLARAATNNPFKYEPREGCRIMPVLKRLGTHLAELKEIHGVNERVERLLAKDTKQPDPILFELLVALLWKINGFDSVEFLDESPNKRTPDLRASNGVDEWFIECKRLDKHSQYTRKERAKWRAMWSLLSDRLVSRRSLHRFRHPLPRRAEHASRRLPRRPATRQIESRATAYPPRVQRHAGCQRIAHGLRRREPPPRTLLGPLSFRSARRAHWRQTGPQPRLLCRGRWRIRGIRRSHFPRSPVLCHRRLLVLTRGVRKTARHICETCVRNRVDYFNKKLEKNPKGAVKGARRAPL